METFESIVATYVRDCREGAAREQRWFAIQRTLEEAVTLAALAKGPSGKRLSHQCRISGHVLVECQKRLMANLRILRGAESFEQLYDVVRATIADVHGVGELYTYDTALRIGAKLDLHPRLVFLHAGVRAGARAIGLDPFRKTISPDELPKAFRNLEPREIEDVLCIYKAQLAGAALVARQRQRCAGR